MKSPRSNSRRRLVDPARQRKASPTAKLNSLPEDQVAQIVAWLFQGKTYAQIRDLVKPHFGVTCSIMAVKTIWDKYAGTEEQMRAERIVRRARLLMSVPEVT
jgi:hypothetical protein